ncbi:MAG: hypothetical protein J0G32_00080, partial [Alphaproteobacteria bacterium]|nr:hypothetical protein [Alphaproteobacteria bacterium]
AFQKQLFNLVDGKEFSDIMFAFYRIFKDQDLETCQALYALLPSKINATDKLNRINSNSINLEKNSIIDTILKRFIIKSDVKNFNKLFEIFDINKAIEIYTQRFNNISWVGNLNISSELCEAFQDKYLLYIKSNANLNDEKSKDKAIKSYDIIIRFNKFSNIKTYVTRLYLEYGYKNNIYNFFVTKNLEKLKYLVKQNDVQLMELLIDFYGSDNTANYLIPKLTNDTSLWDALMNGVQSAQPRFNSYASMIKLLYLNLPANEINYNFSEEIFKINYRHYLKCGDWVAAEYVLDLYEKRNTLMIKSKEYYNGFYYSLMNILMKEISDDNCLVYFQIFSNPDLNLRNKIAFDNILSKLYFDNELTFKIYYPNHRPYAYLELLLKNAKELKGLNCSQVKNFIAYNPQNFVKECYIQNELALSLILLNNLEILEYVFNMFDDKQKVVFLENFCSVIKDTKKLSSNLKFVILTNRNIFNFFDIHIKNYLNIENPINKSLNERIFLSFSDPQKLLVLKHLPTNIIEEFVNSEKCADFFNCVFIYKSRLNNYLNYQDFNDSILSRLNDEDRQKALQTLLKEILDYPHTNDNLKKSFHILVSQIQDKNLILDLFLETTNLDYNINLKVNKLQKHIYHIYNNGSAYFIITLLKDEILKLKESGQYDLDKINIILETIQGSIILNRANIIYANLNHDTKLILSKVFLYEKYNVISSVNSNLLPPIVTVNGIYFKEDIIKFISNFSNTLKIAYSNDWILSENHLPNYIRIIIDYTLALATKQSEQITPNWDGMPSEIRAKITRYLGFDYDDMLALRQRAKAKVINHRAALESEQCKEPANHKRKRDDSDNENPPKKIAKTI